MTEEAGLVTVVGEIEGYYDERAQAVQCNINERLRCFSHHWINASLQWESDLKKVGFQTSVSLECPKRQNFNYAWGAGYGAIRFCKKCKLIECIHDFDNPTEYRRVIDDFQHTGYSVSMCKICSRRILKSSWNSFTPTNEAFALIMEVAKELGLPWNGDPRSSGYGSNYFTIFPSETSRLLKVSRQVASKYVEGVFRRGYCCE